MEGQSYGEHITVLKQECIDYLTQYSDTIGSSIIVDYTLGGGGHTRALAEVSKSLKIFSVDQDIQAIENFKKINIHENIFTFHMNFADFPDYYMANKEKINPEDLPIMGFLMDLGVSSHHFDSAERGFSFRNDGPLDMRMSDKISLTAAEIVNTFSENKISEILWEYGEEKLHKRISAQIVESRLKKDFETTKELENLIFHCYPKKMRHGKTHPATRSFQALRIFVNDELNVLDCAINKSLPLLSNGGRMAIISFHSLEDRRVKHLFKGKIKENKELFKILTKKPQLPTQQEILRNSRSRSAKLRVIEKL